MPTGSRVLDVGAASGTLGRMCARYGHVIRGIEPNAGLLGEARPLYAELFDGTLEQAPDSYLAGHDAVVCGDVLEHLPDPGEQLRRLVKDQNDGCIFIISVPNVANLWVRLNLLIGHFDYTDRGILDRTHLHFYTRRTFLEIVKSARLEIKSVRVTPIPLELISPFFERKLIGRGAYTIFAWMTEKLPTLLGYQWIAEAMIANPT